MEEHNTLENYEHPFVTVDVILFTIAENALKVVLIKRGIEPFKDSWAIPGGFVRIDESLEQAALRELEEEVGVKNVYLEQLYTFGDLGRDPRSRVITIAYYALVPSQEITLHAATDAAEAEWYPVTNLPALAFDHSKIISYALERIRGKLEYSTIAQGLLPDKFRLSELQRIYEIILGTAVDKRNFRKKMLSLDILEPTAEVDASGAHRPAQLYCFKSRPGQVI